MRQAMIRPGPVLTAFGAGIALAGLLMRRPGFGPGGIGDTAAAIVGIGLGFASVGLVLVTIGRPAKERWRPPAIAAGAALVVLGLTTGRLGLERATTLGWKVILIGLGLALVGGGLSDRRETLLGIVRTIPVPAAAVFAGGVGLRAFFMYSYRPGFFGFPDSVGYLAFARENVFATPYRPAGEVLFVRLMRHVSPNLSVTVLAHHAVGVATAWFLYLAVRRLGASVWLSLVPAAVVLFGGTQVFLEHSTMSEPTFSFLVAVALYCLVRRWREGRLAWSAAGGAALGLAATVRAVGLSLLVLLAVWALFAHRPVWPRGLASAGTQLGAGLAMLLPYLAVQTAVTGQSGITRTQGETLYARVAPFADCSRFDPPAGTRVLCESSDPDDRPAPVVYMFNPSLSPALRAFGAPSVVHHATSKSDFDWPPDATLARFGRTVLRHQPLDYLESVALGMANYVTPKRVGPKSVHDWNSRDLVMDMRSSYEQTASKFFSNLYLTSGFLRRNAVALDDYGRYARVEGPLTMLLVLVLAAGLVLGRGPLRGGALLFGLVAVGLMLATVMSLYYDARYATPTYGFLTAGAALAAGALAQRWPLGSIAQRAVGGARTMV